MNTAKKQMVTMQEFAAMPKDEHKNYELIDGIICMSPSPSREHQMIAHRIHGHLFVRLADTMCDAAGELDITYEGDVLKPDLMVFCNRDDEIPEIVFEILSPSTRHRDLGIKLVKYEQMGVKEYWIIDPKTKSITIHNYVNHHAETYIISEIARSEVQPELKIAVADIF